MPGAAKATVVGTCNAALNFLEDGDGDGNPLENAKHNGWGKGGHLEFGVSLVHEIRWTPFFSEVKL